MLTPDQAAYRILAVDDEPHILQILKFTLEKAGYQVITAQDGVEALELIGEVKPHLVILDVMMPKMDGFEVCRKMREDFKMNQIPIIMLTARGDLNEKVKGLEGGANDYLIKPYSNEELLLRVRNVLEWNIRQKEANPLTGLPGNTAIERELKSRIDQGKPFAFLYIDIDNFKGFNDFYGYQKGDEIIEFLAGVLSRTVEKLGTKDDFIGHIGGDDFVLVTAPARAEFIAQHIIEEFDKNALFVLSEDDVERGYLEVTSRQGDVHRVPLMAVTIALVISTDYKIKHFAEISDIAKEVKNYGKKIKGSVVVKERRQDEISPAKKGKGR
ncbi:MAG: response regulator [Candidatus Latescibacteria bacterium]|nr:response regulator [Candidatus Latescibacterota bacterium]NIM22595.1 response regulator [Candidatus Latescibacterota bacterium]NIM64884.1 response regulator [Candidatus Latescibacterota bacterium]NIO01399.1 response regulator [Candidatus Latescibacterota bacterium]NIO27909.1 response regulator [Candidatus Latescibacterota bacterium]